MESWPAFNYDSNDTSEWMRLMNLSTVEWSVGPFPPNLIAIKGALSDIDANTLPRDALVISFATPEQRTGFLEKFTIGLTLGVIIFHIVNWLFWTWRAGYLISPRRVSLQDIDSTGGEDLSQPVQGDDQRGSTSGRDSGDADNNLSLAQFRRTLGQFYFEPVATELEPFRKPSSATGYSPMRQNFKETAELAWEAIRIEAELRSFGGDAARISGAAADLRGKKIVVLNRIRDAVRAWDCRGRASWWNRWPSKSRVWKATERKGMEEIKALLHQLLPPSPTE